MKEKLKKLRKGARQGGFGARTTRPVDATIEKGETPTMSITLDFDEETLASLPLGPGERERHMQIEQSNYGNAPRGRGRERRISLAL